MAKKYSELRAKLPPEVVAAAAARAKVVLDKMHKHDAPKSNAKRQNIDVVRENKYK